MNKDRIMKAVQEGIKSGFKFSPDSIVDDSSYINFEDSKVNNVESLSINIYLKEYIENENWDKAFDIVKKYSICTYKAKNDNELREIIKKSIHYLGKKSNLNWIDVSNVTDMSYMFYYSKFNGDISEWNVSHVTNMHCMFCSSQFNEDISKWDVSNVKDMSHMFTYSQFNGDISRWNVSNVTNMNRMFDHSQFNEDISKWDVSNVKDMSSAFNNSKFNKNISAWNLHNGCRILFMFNNSIIENKNKPKCLQQ